MTLTISRALSAAILAAPLLLNAGVAQAQDSRGGVFDNLFNRGQQNEQSEQGGSSSNASDIAVRLDRLEAQLRQLTGTVEQLQYHNQQLEMQLKRMQDDTDYRLQQLGSKGGSPRAAAPMSAPMNAPMNAPMSAPTTSSPPREQGAPGRRSDEFDPARHPNAPGVGRTLGQIDSGTPTIANNESPIGAPGGREAGAPLDLSTMTGNAQSAPVQNASDNPGMGSQLPPPPARNTSATGTQLATLPPSGSPRDEYDLAYGYVLHKDYALAEQGFRDYLRKYPDDGRAAEAQYWLGESLYQRQKYRDAGEAFLAVTTKYERSGKAPDALLRLGQSLAAMHQKEAACATFGEVARKYPRASASVKRGVTQEQKRTHC